MVWLEEEINRENRLEKEGEAEEQRRRERKRRERLRNNYFSAKQWNALPDFFRTGFFADFKGAVSRLLRMLAFDRCK